MDPPSLLRRSLARRGLVMSAHDRVARTAYWFPPDAALAARHGMAAGAVVEECHGAWLHVWVPADEAPEDVVAALERAVYYAHARPPKDGAAASAVHALVAAEIRAGVRLVEAKRPRPDGTRPRYPALDAHSAQWILEWHEPGTAAHAAAELQWGAPPPGMQRLAVRVRHHVAWRALVTRLLERAPASDAPAPTARDADGHAVSRPPPRWGLRIYDRQCVCALAPPTALPAAAAAAAVGGTAAAMGRAADALWEAASLGADARAPPADLAPYALAPVGPGCVLSAEAAGGQLALDTGETAPAGWTTAVHWRVPAQAAWRVGAPCTASTVLLDAQAHAAAAPDRRVPAALAAAASKARRDQLAKARKARERAEAEVARDRADLVVTRTARAGEPAATTTVRLKQRDLACFFQRPPAAAADRAKARVAPGADSTAPPDSSGNKL